MRYKMVQQDLVNIFPTDKVVKAFEKLPSCLILNNPTECAGLLVICHSVLVS